MRAEQAAKLTEESLSKQIATVLALIKDCASEGKHHATFTDKELANEANFIVEALRRLCYNAHAISSNSISVSW